MIRCNGPLAPSEVVLQGASGIGESLRGASILLGTDLWQEKISKHWKTVPVSSVGLCRQTQAFSQETDGWDSCQASRAVEEVRDERKISWRVALSFVAMS